MSLKLCVVTATTDEDQAMGCFTSWGPETVGFIFKSGLKYSLPYLGVVPSFNVAVEDALADARHFDIIACLHDDLEIHDPHWVERVCSYFEENPRMGLAGFGGAIGLGDADLYQKPYAPEQLARKGFRSNLVDAEAHGRRSLIPERVACLDGFSQIGRREFWEGQTILSHKTVAANIRGEGPWTILERLGFIHHFYDGALGCLAARHGWETWYLPIACRHYGGRTAVGDRGYNEWAQGQIEGGDRGFWEQAHRIGFENFRDVLPLAV